MENILPDALSRMYALDAPGTERSPSEYIEYDSDSPQAGNVSAHLVTMPSKVGVEALASIPGRSRRMTASVAHRVPPAETGRQRSSHVGRKIVSFSLG
jgi:hypothetical protein